MKEGCRKALTIGAGLGRTGMMAIPGLGAIGALGKAAGGAGAASGAASAAGGGSGAMGGIIGSLFGGGSGGDQEDQITPFQVGDLAAQRQAALAPIDFGADLAADVYNRKPPYRIFS